MAHRPRPECAPKRRAEKPKPVRDPIAALDKIDPRLTPETACIAIVNRTRKVFRQRRAAG